MKNVATLLNALQGLNLALELINRAFDESPFLATFSSTSSMQEIVNRLKRQIKELQLETQIQMSDLQTEYPDIVVGMKTKCAILAYLRHAKEEIEKLQHKGDLEETEAQLLADEIRDKMLVAEEILKGVEPLTFHQMIKSHPLFGKFASHLCEHVPPKEIKFKKDEFICSQHDGADGIYFLYEGMAIYKKYSTDIPTYGELIFQNPIHAGNFICEMGFLFNESRRVCVQALTPCTTYFFARDQLVEAIDNVVELSGFRDKLLHQFCIYRCSELLRTLPKYCTWTETRLSALVMQATYKVIKPGEEFYFSEAHQRYQYVLLIHGRLQDATDQKVYDDHRLSKELPPMHRFHNISDDESALIFMIPYEDKLQFHLI